MFPHPDTHGGSHPPAELATVWTLCPHSQRFCSSRNRPPQPPQPTQLQPARPPQPLHPSQSPLRPHRSQHPRAASPTHPRRDLRACTMVANHTKITRASDQHHMKGPSTVSIYMPCNTPRRFTKLTTLYTPTLILTQPAPSIPYRPHSVSSEPSRHAA